MVSSMLSSTRLKTFSKIAVVTALGGSFYLFKDEIKPYFKFDNVPKHTTPAAQPELITPARPKTIENLPKRVPYLLIGGGTASHSAMRSIRGTDPNARVLIVGSENRSPYMRPALSKELWYSEQDLRRKLNFKWWSGKEKSIFYEIDEFYIPIEKLEKRDHGGVSLLKNIRLARLDPDNQTAYLENGQTIEYDKCLLAPGGTPKTLPQFDSASAEVKERVLYFRTADDFLKLEKISQIADRIVVIGGGFLGSELTCALAKRKTDEKVPEGQIIHQIYPEVGNLGKVLPHYLSECISEKVKNEGAQLVPNAEVTGVSMKKEVIELKLSNGDTIEADYIVCAIGLEPDVELAKSSGLEVDQRTGGYLVNSELEARTNVWVAGDAACFYDMKLGRRRVEHHDHAINSGRLAGINMVERGGKPYLHQSMFWSDIGHEISFEAVGIIDSDLNTVAVFTEQEEVELNTDVSKLSDSLSSAGTDRDTNDKSKKNSETEKYNRGIVFYLKNDIVVGILLWNLFGRLNTARRILNEQKKYDDFNELAKLFNLYLDD